MKKNGLMNMFKLSSKKTRRTKRRKTKSFNLFQNLPDDVLNHIFHRLDFYSWIAARGVCRAWRDLSHLPPIPWVCANIFNQDRLELSPAAATTTATSPCIPILHLRKLKLDVVGSHGQYVIANSKGPGGIAPVIYNAFSSKLFSLPLKSIIYKEDGSSSIRPINLPLRLAIMSSPPTSTVGECVVAAIDKDHNLCVCRLGVDPQWIRASPKCYCITDLFFHGGDLCLMRLLDFFMSTKLDDLFLDGGPRIQFDEYYRGELLLPFKKAVDYKAKTMLSCRHMVSSCGELLLVTIYKSIWFIKQKSFSFKVHRKDGKEMVPVDDLGDRMLFIGKGCSMSFSGNEINGFSCIVDGGFFTTNCIYFVTWCNCKSYECINGFSCDCARDKVRAQSLLRWSLADQKFVGPIKISSTSSLMWITSPPIGKG